MKPEEIEQLLKFRPFEPFAIHFSDGRFIEVTHPESVVLHRNKMEHGTPIKNGSLILDKVEYFSYIHVVSVEVLRPQTTEQN